MGVNATSNQQLLKFLVDLIENNQNALSKMNEQAIASTIYSYVYNDYMTNNIIIFLLVIRLNANTEFLYNIYNSVIFSYHSL